MKGLCRVLWIGDWQSPFFIRGSFSTVPDPVHGIALPEIASVVGKTQNTAQPESEETVPPDDGFSEKRTVFPQIGHSHPQGEGTQGGNGGDPGVSRPLKDSEKGNIQRKNKNTGTDGLQIPCPVPGGFRSQSKIFRDLPGKGKKDPGTAVNTKESRTP